MAQPSWRTDKRTAAQRGYDSRWRKARSVYLRAHPMCVLCQQTGRLTLATVVDHKTPHRGDQSLFWAQDNWQSLCKQCHDGAKKSLEMTGRLRGADAAGVPLDAAHHWHATG